MTVRRRSRLARLVRWLVAVPVALIMILFVVSNRQAVELSLYPLPLESGPVPLYLVGLGGVLAGFLAGGLVVWLSSRRWRRRAREEARARHRAEAERAALERQLDATERDSSEEPAPSRPSSLPAAGNLGSST